MWEVMRKHTSTRTATVTAIERAQDDIMAGLEITFVIGVVRFQNAAMILEIVVRIYAI